MESSISERPRAGRAPAIAVLFVVAISARTLMAAPAAPPAAGPEVARETARARLVEGVELLRGKQFAQALAKFDEAYALVPSANIFYDRGLAYQGLGRDADALEAFDAFLAHADHPPPGTREKATHERDQLRTRVATLAVTSDPPAPRSPSTAGGAASRRSAARSTSTPGRTKWRRAIPAPAW